MLAWFHIASYKGFTIPGSSRRRDVGVLVVNVADIDGVEYKESCQQDKDTSSQIASPHQEGHYDRIACYCFSYS